MSKFNGTQFVITTVVTVENSRMDTIIAEWKINSDIKQLRKLMKS